MIKLFINKTYYDFFWFCDFSTFLFAIFFFCGSIQLVKALINIGLLTQLFTLVIIVFNAIKNRKHDIAFSRGKFYFIVEILIHLSVPLALIFTYNVAPNLLSTLYSLIILVVMFLVTLIFTKPKRNINLIYNLEIDYKKNPLKLPFHTTLWIIYSFIIVIITFLIQYYLYKLI